VRYTTEFEGRFKLSKPLTSDQVNYLNAFSDVRHMRRRTSMVLLLPDPKREAVGLPAGTEGEFYVGGQDSQSVINHNEEPATQPGLWCQWVPTDDGMNIEWNGAEKFYAYVEWLQYIIDNFLEPWGIKISGSVRYQGEDIDDGGWIYIDKDGRVATRKATFDHDFDEDDGPGEEDGPWAAGYEQRSSVNSSVPSIVAKPAPTVESLERELEDLKAKFEAYKGEVDEKIESAIDQAVDRAVYRVGHRMLDEK
jgi:hypothetical protein